nr:hypothetical protein [Tanacetum cinerariifolium]
IFTRSWAEYINTLSWNRPAFYNYDNDDDEDYTIAITPVLSTEEPVASLIIEDEYLDTIPTTKSNEVIKSSIEDLVSIPSESEGILENMCDVPFCDNSPPFDILKDQFEDFSDSNDDSISIDDDYLSIDDIDYVEASPPDSELVSLEVVKHDILREKLLNIHLLIAKIESLNDNLTPDRVLKSPFPFPIPVEDSDYFFEKFDNSLSHSDNSLLELKNFSDHTKETSNGSTTTHSDYSLPEYDSFFFEVKPDQGELTSVVMEDILGEPRVHVPNVLPTHPTLYLDLNFTPYDDSLRFDLEVSFPSETRNKIFDPGIFFDVQSKIFLSQDAFYISFIHDPLCPVIETLLPFLSENEDQVFNLGILSSNLLSHRGKITSDLPENPMIIFRGDIPFLDSSSSFPIPVADSDSFFEKSDTSLSYSDNSLSEFETFSDHTEETRSGSTTAHANNSLSEYDSFRFEIEPNQGRLTSVVIDKISDDSTNDPLLEAVDLFFASDNSIPRGIENIDYDLEGEIHFLEKLLSNDSIPLLKNDSSNFDHHDDPSFPRPPPEPPNDEVFFDFEPDTVF